MRAFIQKLKCLLGYHDWESIHPDDLLERGISMNTNSIHICVHCDLGQRFRDGRLEHDIGYSVWTGWENIYFSEEVLKRLKRNRKIADYVQCRRCSWLVHKNEMIGNICPTCHGFLKDIGD
jgi:hypothetical protein